MAFGKGDERFLAHHITMPPDFDHVVAVRQAPGASGAELTDNALRKGPALEITGRPDGPGARLREGDQVAAGIVGDGAAGTACDVPEILRAAALRNLGRSDVMGLFPAEIKVNVEGDVPGALSALRSSRGVLTSRRIWFAEGREGIAQGRTPLLDDGVIVRFRLGGGAEDLTVKLRPCEREQLAGRFSAPFQAGPFTYRIEQDWSSNGRVLAASLVRDCPPGTLGDAVVPEADAAAAMDAVQDQFLHACAPSVPLDGLTALGPVLSTKIDDVPLDDLEVDLEVWSVTGLQFLEASTRVKPKDEDDRETFTARAERKQRKLQEAVRERGVTLSEHPENKTRRVLTALVEAGGRPA